MTASVQQKSMLRKIPSVEEILQSKNISSLLKEFPRSVIVETTQEILKNLRNQIKLLDKKKTEKFTFPDDNTISLQIQSKLSEKMMPQFRKVINASGIILHTALGRAVLASQVTKALNKELAGYTRLAIDFKTGKRLDRDKIIENLICRLTGAEASTIANNNAAATMLILNTLAKGKEVICSRGQMVEIGGSFRIPEIMATSGAKLVEIGTTNRTHLKDYQKAITENTGALLRVHNSNYKITGFTSQVPLEDLVKLGKKHKLPVVDDIGSGALIDLKPYGFKNEPRVSDSIKKGADVACFSTDKLIGGPQGGIIIGKKKYIDKIRKNPLARAFRIGKLNLIALEVTLKMFLNKETLFNINPTLQMLTADIKTVESKAKNLKNKLQKSVKEIKINIIDEYSQPGSGSLAGYDIPTKVLAVKINKLSAKDLAEKLRTGKTAIFTRIKDNQVLLDPRTTFKSEEPEIIKAFKEIV